jgi:hypothetical protein
MKKHKARGHKIVVWSAGGWEWAKSVVETLELTEIVDLVMSKPAWFYDDIPSSSFMPEHNRIYKPDAVWTKEIKANNADAGVEDTEDGGECTPKTTK